MRRIAFILSFLAFSSGCMSWRSGTIPTNQIPPPIQAIPKQNQPGLDLTKLSPAAQRPHHVQAGDVLDVKVNHLYEENHIETIQARVLDDGTVLLPLAGKARVANMTLAEAEEAVGSAYLKQSILRNVQINVALHQPVKSRIYVLGAVTRPGPCDLNPNESDLFCALVAAGGITGSAGSKVEIRRRTRPGKEHSSLAETLSAENKGTNPGNAPQTSFALMSVQQSSSDAPAQAGDYGGTETVRLDCAKQDDGYTLAAGLPLENGDVVIVEERIVKPIYLVGLVSKPGEYKLPCDRDIRVLEAIGLAGGVDRVSVPSKAVVIRQYPEMGSTVAIRIDLNRAKRDLSENILLMPGDTLSVEETCGSYLRGLFRGALRVGVGADLTTSSLGY